MACDRKIGPFDCCSVVQGDCLELMKLLPDGCVDAVITDPPYPREYLHLYEGLAQSARHALKDGSLLAAMCGPIYFPEIIASMSKHMDYHWLLAYSTPGAQAAQVWPRRAISFWKPIVTFSKGKYRRKWFGDAVTSAVNDNDKLHHKWGQSESGMVDVLKRLTVEPEVVLDPFAGAGTTLVAAKKLGRHFLGFEISPEYCEIARKRIAAVEAQPTLFEPKRIEQRKLEL
jgi:DNA modification methylase